MQKSNLFFESLRNEASQKLNRHEIRQTAIIQILRESKRRKLLPEQIEKLNKLKQEEE